MPFRIRPGEDTPSGGFTVFAVDAREALDRANAMLERGIQSVEILDGDGRPYDLAELERLTAELEAAGDSTARARAGPPEADNGQTY